MSRVKIREITVQESKGTFGIFKQTKVEKSEYNFEGMDVLRKILSNEKARILHAIKHKKPESIYALAKMLGRTFKAVHDDLKLLERLGFIEFMAEKKDNRTRHKPEIVVDMMTIHIKI